MMISGEKDLYHIWEKFCSQAGQTSDKRLTGIDAGQPNFFSGPDFQGAEFELDGKLYRGDVEIHLKSSDWYTHLHHLDQRYSQVLLHLAWEADTEMSVLNSRGQPVTTLSMRTFPPLPKPVHLSAICKWQNRRPEQVNGTLKMLALQRLKLKHQLIARMGDSQSYDQVLYQLFLRILGKPHNVNNFLILAEHLPWRELMQLKERCSMSAVHWLTLLAMKTGLIAGPAVFRRLQLIQPQIEAFTGLRISALKAHAWQFSGQRPQNSPVRHLMVFAEWLHHFRGRSLYFELKQLLMRRLPESQAIRSLNMFFLPPAGEKPQKTQPARPFWGRAKRTEIIANMVLPFFHFESVMQDSTGFKAYLESLYFALPHTGPYRRLQILYAMPGLHTDKKRKFWFNQGLLYLKSNYCDRGRCRSCPFELLDKEIDKNDENI